MNNWFRRAVGSVGVAGGILLLGAGTVPAPVAAPASMDPQRLPGLLDDLLKPAGGPNSQGLVLNAPDRGGPPTSSLSGPAALDSRSLGVGVGVDVGLGVDTGLGVGLDVGLGVGLDMGLDMGLGVGVDGPNMIGDDFVDQSPYAGS